VKQIISIGNISLYNMLGEKSPKVITEHAYGKDSLYSNLPNRNTRHYINDTINEIDYRLSVLHLTYNWSLHLLRAIWRLLTHFLLYLGTRKTMRMTNKKWKYSHSTQVNKKVKSAIMTSKCLKKLILYRTPDYGELSKYLYKINNKNTNVQIEHKC